MKKGRQFIYELDGRLYINLTNSCCNACEFCLRQNSDGVGLHDTLWLEYEPSAEEVIALIGAVNFDFTEAVFCGYGESTYRLNELTLISEYLHSINKIVRLNTNGLGSLINNMDIVPILKGRVDCVSVSLNESDAEGYLRLCHSIFGLRAFDAMLEFTQKCAKAGIDTSLTVVDLIGKNSIKKCKQIAQNLGVKLRIRNLIENNVSHYS